MAWLGPDVEGLPIRRRPSSPRQLPYILLKAGPPELQNLQNLLQQQINMSHLSGKPTASIVWPAFKEENEIWSQLYSNCREAQMFLLFLPFHILLKLPSLLPSLPVPSIWQTAARKPGCIHNSSPKPQLIIRPAITQHTLHWLRRQRGFLCFSYSLHQTEAMQSNLPLLHISAGLERCFDQRNDGAGVRLQLHVSVKPHSFALRSPGVVVGRSVRRPILFNS